jgi:hypothetical protein
MMFNPSLGRWMTEDPIGYSAGDVNLFRTVSNNPVNRLDPSGLADKDKELGFDFDTSIEKIQEQLEDGKVGYDFTFLFTLAQKDTDIRRFGLQAVKGYMFTVTADGRITRPPNADKGGWTYTIDQVDLSEGPKSFKDRRALIAGEAKTDKDKAVFVYYVVQATAGLSGVVQPKGGQYIPVYNDDKTKPLTGLTTIDNYNTVFKGITAKSTDTELVYIYYNPGACKNASKVVTDAMDKEKLTETVTKTLGNFKQKLGDDGFELLSFPKLFGDKNPLIGKIK